jgi:transcriptional regulator GlxA family with amidase domain
MTHRVVVLILNGVLPLDLGIPLQIFGRDDLDFYSLSTASPGGLPVTAMSGITIGAEEGLDALEAADTVIIPGYGDVRNPLDGPTIEALRLAHGRGARMVSICSGAFALAQAGILDGLGATTHWARCAELAGAHPLVRVDPQVLFVDEGSVLTSAGVAAGIDLSLYIVRKDLGAATANRVARQIVAAPRREGQQAQFIEYPQLGVGEDALAATRQWMLASLHEPLTVALMADHARVSVRGFSRHFSRQTGSTPLRWLHAQRIEVAKELLETSTLSVDEVSVRCGLGSPANFRVHFKRATRLSPLQYRRQFLR